jgi:hypothetical protein
VGVHEPRQCGLKNRRRGSGKPVVWGRRHVDDDIDFISPARQLADIYAKCFVTSCSSSAPSGPLEPEKMTRID